MQKQIDKWQYRYDNWKLSNKEEAENEKAEKEHIEKLRLFKQKEREEEEQAKNLHVYDISEIMDFRKIILILITLAVLGFLIYLALF